MNVPLALFALGAVLRSAYAQDAPPASYGEAFPDGLSVLDPNGLNNIPSPSYTLNRWAWGTIPQACYDVANDNASNLAPVYVEGYCNPYDVEVYDVSYSDCGATFQICRCNNAGMNVDQVADRFGRVPVTARQWVRIVNAYSGDFCSAWANTVDLTFFGDCSSGESVFLHETSHNLDYRVAGGNSWYSQTDDWKNKVAQGSCVADNYAKSTYTEAFAQVGVMAFYNANVGSIWDWNVGCMADQVGRTIELLGDSVVYDSSRFCTRVWTHSDPICMGPAARDSGNCPNLKKAPPVTDPSITVVDGEAVMDAVVESLKREAEVSAGLLKKRRFSA